MSLSWNEIAIRAKRFSISWKDANYEKGETQSFYNDFFDVFGRRRRDVALYERAVSRLNNKRGFIDLFWKSVLLIEQKSKGRNLDKALIQAEDYYLNLEENEELNLNNLNQENSNGLENFELNDESPKLFNNDDGTNHEIVEEKPILESEDDELEIPAFLRRQKN